ncbi:MAG: sugar transferase, partial [Paramuribaculum sp.]|nr:sugar transferase [Paramuribaculum sp.]
MYSNFFKRIIDIVVSGCALLILAIPLFIITIWLHFANKGAGAFFFQKRPGK